MATESVRDYFCSVWHIARYYVGDTPTEAVTHVEIFNPGNLPVAAWTTCCDHQGDVVPALRMFVEIPGRTSRYLIYNPRMTIVRGRGLLYVSSYPYPVHVRTRYGWNLEFSGDALPIDAMGHPVEHVAHEGEAAPIPSLTGAVPRQALQLLEERHRPRTEAVRSIGSAAAVLASEVPVLEEEPALAR